VLECGTGLATSYCGKLLADAGFDVLKVSPVGRAWADSTSCQADETLELFLSESKDRVRISCDSSTGRRLFQTLAGQADVLVHSLGAPDDQWIRSLVPLDSINEISISSFGKAGPYSEHEATELTMAAISGWMFAMGDPDLAPLFPGGPYISYLTGSTAAFAALLAMEVSECFEEKTSIEVTEFETGVACLPFDTLHFSYTGTHRRRSGELYASNPLTAIYPCADGYVQFQASFRPQEFLEMIGGPELAGDPRFSSPASRVQHQDELGQIVKDWLSTRGRWEIFEEASRRRIVISPVPDFSEVLSLPPHLERRYFRAGSGYLSNVSLPGPAYRLHGPNRESVPVPPHSRAALSRRLGISDETIEALRQKGELEWH